MVVGYRPFILRNQPPNGRIVALKAVVLDRTTPKNPSALDRIGIQKYIYTLSASTCKVFHVAKVHLTTLYRNESSSIFLKLRG